jgi:hypothetical protein
MKKIARLMTLALVVFALASCEDVPSPFGTVTPPKGDSRGSDILPTGDGTANNPFNIAAAIAKCKEIGTTESTEKFYVKGIVVSAGAADASYGNASFYMADAEDSSQKFYAFQVLGSDGKKMSAGYAINVGDVVVIYGPIYNYKGNTPETVGKGAAHIVTINGKKTDEGDTPTPSGDAKGTGTLEDPFNAAAATNEALKLASGSVSDKAYYIKGKVAEIAVDKNGNVQNFDYGTYGNASFYVSDDGTTTNKFYCYRVLYLGNKKWATGSGDVLKVGDDVVVCAKLTNYNGTPETQQNEGYLYSLNGKTEGGGGGDVTPGQPQGDGSEGNPFNVAAAIAKCKEAGETATTQSYYIKGITDNDYTISSYKNFEANIVDSEGSSETFKVFRVKDKDGKGLKEGWKIAKGSTIIVYGPVVNYKGNTPETATGAYLVSVNGKDPELDGGTGGGDTPGGGNELTVAASSLGLDNGVEVGSKTLADGTTLTCDGGGNTNAPKYYTAGNGTVRMYPNNTMALNASKKIASIEIVCNEYNETLYNASGNVTATSGTKAIEGAVVKFTGINASSVTITNSAEGSGAATQIRWESLKITYAE